jgi:hypothetical protein
VSDEGVGETASGEVQAGAEPSVWDQATEWVSDTFGSGESGYDQGPISVPEKEWTQEDQQRLDDSTRKSELINSLRDQVKPSIEQTRTEAAYLRSKADSQTLSAGEMATLAGQLRTVAGQCSGAASQLEAAGIEDWVYSVKAFHSAAWRLNHAADQAQAADSQGFTECHIALGEIDNAIVGAEGEVGGM